MADLSLVIMAAGVGSRFGGLKQVAAVGPSGEVTVAYSIHDALRAGFQRVVFIIRKDMEDIFRERIGRFAESRMETAYVFQELDRLPVGFSVPRDRVKPWGTGHAILCCKDAVREPFAVINADDFYGAEAYRVLADHLRSTPDADAAFNYAMAGFILKNTLSPHGTVARGVCDVDAQGYLRDVTERTQIQRMDGQTRYADGGRWLDVPEDAIVSMNMWGFRPNLFAELALRFEEFLRRNAHNPRAEFYIPAVVAELVRAGKARVKILATQAEWYGVTYKEDLPLVQEAVRAQVARGAYPANLNPT